MPEVRVALGAKTYSPLEVPDGCTVGHWKELLDQGFLGKPVAYAAKLRCLKDLTGRLLENEEALPPSPECLDVRGPPAVLGMLDLALRQKLGPPSPKAAEPAVSETCEAWEEVCRAVGAPSVPFALELSGPQDEERVLKLAAHAGPNDTGPTIAEHDEHGYLEHGDELGGHRVLRRLGEGFSAVVYLARHLDSDVHVALKWPLRPNEFLAWRCLQERAAGASGLPPLLSWGEHRGEGYGITELLGADLTRALVPLGRHPLRRRWAAVKVVGRLLLRRIETVHRCGLVHCDVSPYNVLFGLSTPGGRAVTLYLIDFGLAQAAVAGPNLGPSQGTAEFNSVRTAAGSKRLPHDDVESLGWVLLWLLWGGLPWMEADFGGGKDFVMKVWSAKRRLLDDGWASFTGSWTRLADTPQGLRSIFACCCWRDLLPPVAPDYVRLASLLGGREGLDAQEAEEEDAREWRVHVVPLL